MASSSKNIKSRQALHVHRAHERKKGGYAARPPPSRGALRGSREGRSAKTPLGRRSLYVIHSPSNQHRPEGQLMEAIILGIRRSKEGEPLPP
ncbi:hypothetical protein MTO96_008714 [Rhipicephalus appendiculatus]